MANFEVMADGQLLSLAQQALQIEAQALLDMRERLSGPAGQSLVKAVRLVLACSGRVVVMGMGKSGHVGRKIAATLASTGTPAMFVHPAEAHHGDLGMVTPGDVCWLCRTQARAKSSRACCLCSSARACP